MLNTKKIISFLFFFITLFSFSFLLLFPARSYATPYADCGSKTSDGLSTGICMSESDTSINCQSGTVSGGTTCDTGEKCCKNSNVTGNNTSGTANSNNTTSSGGIVPCGKSGGSPCTLCHLIVGVQNLVNFGKNILITVAIVGLVIAGLIYMLSSGSESMITTAKNCFKASLVGFAVTVAAWLAVNTVLFWLIPTKNDLGIQVSSWNSFTCDTASSATTGGGTTTPTAAQIAQNKTECDNYCNNGGDVDLGTDVATCKTTCMDAKAKEQTGSPVASTGTGLSQSDAQKALDTCGVKYASANTLGGLQDSTISELCGFKNSSGCAPLITTNGGTTGSHASGVCSHSTGCKSDFRPDSCNDAWIKANYSNTGTRSDGAACYSAPDGACYAREGDHWDMSTTRSCSAQGC